jgi:hypothetical protein
MPEGPGRASVGRARCCRPRRRAASGDCSGRGRVPHGALPAIRPSPADQSFRARSRWAELLTAEPAGHFRCLLVPIAVCWRRDIAEHAQLLRRQIVLWQGQSTLSALGQSATPVCPECGRLVAGATDRGRKRLLPLSRPPRPELEKAGGEQPAPEQLASQSTFAGSRPCDWDMSGPRSITASLMRYLSGPSAIREPQMTLIYQTRPKTPRLTTSNGSCAARRGRLHAGSSPFANLVKGPFTATSTLTCSDALGEARPPWRSPSSTY